MNKMRLWNSSFPNQNLFFDIDRMFEDFTRPVVSEEKRIRETQFKETDDAYLISVDMPGVKSEDLELSIDGGVLSINASRKDHFADENSERRTLQTYSRRWTLPENVDEASLEAHLEDGILQLALPKKEKEEAKTIKVQSGPNRFFKKLLSGTE